MKPSLLLPTVKLAFALGAQSPATSHFAIEVHLSTRVDSGTKELASTFTGRYVVSVTMADTGVHRTARVVLDTLTGTSQGEAYGFLSSARLLGLGDAFMTAHVDSTGIAFDIPLLSSTYWAPSIYAVSQELSVLFGNGKRPKAGETMADTISRFAQPTGGPRETTGAIRSAFTEQQTAEDVRVRLADSTLTMLDAGGGTRERMMSIDTTRYDAAPSEWLRRTVNRTATVSTVRWVGQDSIMVFTKDEVSAKRLP